MSTCKIEQQNCTCGSTQPQNTLLIEYLFLDLKTCDRCIGTDQVLEEVIKTLTPSLELAGYTIDYRKIEMATSSIAREYRFISSPTIRINGRDICGEVAENACGCCSDISGTDVSCRIFTFEGRCYEVPPKAMLAQAILKGIFAPMGTHTPNYSMPDNLRAFYEGKLQKQSCCCHDNCCEK